MKGRFAQPLLLAALAVCGEYQLAGKLQIVNGAGTILEVGEGTASAERLTLEGLDVDDRFNFDQKFVKMNVRIHTLGNEKALPQGRYLGKIQPASPREEAKKDFATLIRKTGCDH